MYSHAIGVLRLPMGSWLQKPASVFRSTFAEHKGSQWHSERVGLKSVCVCVCRVHLDTGLTGCDGLMSGCAYPTSMRPRSDGDRHWRSCTPATKWPAEGRRCHSTCPWQNSLGYQSIVDVAAAATIVSNKFCRILAPLATAK